MGTYFVCGKMINKLKDIFCIFNYLAIVESYKIKNTILKLIARLIKIFSLRINCQDRYFLIRQKKFNISTFPLSAIYIQAIQSQNFVAMLNAFLFPA